MEIHVIRHTKVAVDAGLCYGQADVDLSASFLDEVQNYRRQLDATYDVVISSPLSRCQKLGTQFTTDLIFDNRIMEMNFGDWELKSWDKLDQSILQNWMDDFVEQQVPNGESLCLLYQRVVHFLKEISEASKYQNKKLLIITHAGVIRCIWAYILEIPLKNIFKIPVGFGEVLKIKVSADNNFTTIIQK